MYLNLDPENGKLSLEAAAFIRGTWARVYLEAPPGSPEPIEGNLTPPGALLGYHEPLSDSLEVIKGVVWVEKETGLEKLAVTLEKFTVRSYGPPGVGSYLAKILRDLNYDCTFAESMLRSTLDDLNNLRHQVECLENKAINNGLGKITSWWHKLLRI